VEILSIIPARGGSKGISGKNIKELAGKPLIAHTIEASLKSKYITRTILSTEDAKIKQIALKYGAEVIDRPMELAQDETKTAPVMVHVIKELERNGYNPDIIILLQATCPMRTEKEIDEALELYFNSDCDSIFAAKPAGTTHALWKRHHDGTFEGLYDYRTRPRRQDIDRHYRLYVETGSIYIIRADIFHKVEDFIGENPKIYLQPKCVDIDTIEDFAIAETQMLQRNSGM